MKSSLEGNSGGFPLFYTAERRYLIFATKDTCSNSAFNIWLFRLADLTINLKVLPLHGHYLLQLV